MHKSKTSSAFRPGAVIAHGGQVAKHRGPRRNTPLAPHSAGSEPMTPRDRVLLSECCLISPNFSLLFRIIANKKSRPVRLDRGLVATTRASVALSGYTTPTKPRERALSKSI
ncbi:unnamed protein product, partial [Iphiclides podalirius]